MVENTNQYLEKTEIEGFGGNLFLYKRLENANADSKDIWHYRAKIVGMKGYVRRSTKETNFELAKRKAEQDYIDNTYKFKNKLEVNVTYVRTAIQNYLKHISEKKYYIDNSQRFRYVKNTWYRYMHGYFGDMKVSEITEAELEGYWDYRRDYYVKGAGKELMASNKNRVNAKTQTSRNIRVRFSYGTARAEASVINQFFAWCYDSRVGLTSKVLKTSAKHAFESVDVNKKNRRPHFDEKDWRIVRQNLKNYAECKGRFEVRYDREFVNKSRFMMRTFILFLGSTGMRLGEAKQIRWKDVRFDKKQDAIIINVDESTSKVRRGRDVVAHSSWIGSLLDEWKEISDFTKDSDLVFYAVKENNPDTQNVCDVSVSFKNFLKEIGKLENERGKVRTLYSLRHTYATLRLEAGLEVYKLAKNMGTTVQQIEWHYGHVITKKIVGDLTKGGSLKDTQKAKDIELAAEMITHLRDGTLDEKAVASALKNIAINK